MARSIVSLAADVHAWGRWRESPGMYLDPSALAAQRSSGSRAAGGGYSGGSGDALFDMPPTSGFATGFESESDESDM